MQPVKIGDRVLWFPHADTQKKFRLAFIVALSGKDKDFPAVSLQVLPFEGIGGITNAECGVRRVTDPYHAEHPDVKLRVGGWEALEDYEERIALEAGKPVPGMAQTNGKKKEAVKA